MKTIGVVGAKGDLGGQVVAVLQKHGLTVLQNDIALQDSVPLETLLERCDVVHFCIPADAIPAVSSSDVLLLLHDSVMASSGLASTRQTHHQAVPVHMLMNDVARVIVADGFNRTTDAIEHFDEIGQAAVTMPVAAHDRLIARSQAPLILLIETLLDDLRTWQTQGLLTPSASELLESLESRAARWTPATIQSILKNQEIDELIDELKQRRAQILPKVSKAAIKEL